MNFDYTTETITPESTGMITIAGVQGLELPTGTLAQRPVNSTFTGVISGTTLTASGTITGTITVGQTISGTGVVGNTTIVALGTGTGGAGTYIVDIEQTVASTAMTGAALTAGIIRFNTSTPGMEWYNGSAWINAGTVSSVALSESYLYTVSGSPITTTGTLTLTLNTQAANSIFAGPVSGVAATPTFRQISLANGDLNDVVITSPTNAQVLTYNGTDWVNTGSVPGSYSVLISSWTLVSGTTYTATVTHNLGTQNVIVQCWNATTNALIQLDAITATSASVVTIQINVGTAGLPSYPVRVIVLANGLAIAAGASTPSSVIVENQGVLLSGTYTTLNFAGNLVASTSATGVALIQEAFIKLFTFYPASLDNPNSSDWAVNSLAPVVADPTYPSLTVRQFSTTTEGGVGTFITVPTNATQVSFQFKGRAQTAPGTAAVIQPKLYVRSIPNNAAVGSWSAANVLPVQTVPTNAYFQYYTVAAAALSTYGLAANGQYLIEVTLSTSPTSGTNLASNWLMSEFTVAFS